MLPLTGVQLMDLIDAGFTRRERGRLLFARWRVLSGRCTEGQPDRPDWLPDYALTRDMATTVSAYLPLSRRINV